MPHGAQDSEDLSKSMASLSISQKQPPSAATPSGDGGDVSATPQKQQKARPPAIPSKNLRNFSTNISPNDAKNNQKHVLRLSHSDRTLRTTPTRTTRLINHSSCLPNIGYRGQAATQRKNSEIVLKPLRCDSDDTSDCSSSETN